MSPIHPNNFDHNLVDVDEDTCTIPSIEKCVPGVKYLPNYLSEQQHSDLITAIEKIDLESWILHPNSSRRSLYYGAKYLYDSGQLQTKDVPPITTIKKLYEISKQVNSGLFEYPNEVAQISVHHYTQVQGIAPHSDHDVFGPTVVILSLGSPRVIRFEEIAVMVII